MFLFRYDPNFCVLIQLAMVQFHQQMSALRMILIKGFKKTSMKLCAKALVPFLFMAASILNDCAHISGSHEHLYSTPL
jgi:hypothetical protein